MSLGYRFPAVAAPLRRAFGETAGLIVAWNGNSAWRPTLTFH